VRLQTLRNAAVGTLAGSIDPALILLAGVGASLDFHFNNYLHPASLCAAPHPFATPSEITNPDLLHFPSGNVFTSSVFIVFSVSGNSLRANKHPNVARDLNNLAELLRATNRLAEAEPLCRRALAIYEKSFGPEHPNVARDLNNLAELLSDTNRLAEAEPLYRRALAIDEKSFGPEHPNVATGLNNVAWLLRSTNRLAEAEPLYGRALAIDEKSFGPEHPNVAICLKNYAVLLRKMHRRKEAASLESRANAIRAKIA
jgi:tetratricopeptide (TPR) repeat protein